MRPFLVLLFGGILAAMLWVTVSASLDRSVWAAVEELLPDPWFRATLADAYFGFIAVYCWIFYREPSQLQRSLWFVLLMLLGNIAIAAYVLLQLRNVRGDDPLAELFDRKPS